MVVVVVVAVVLLLVDQCPSHPLLVALAQTPAQDKTATKEMQDPCR